MAGGDAHGVDFPLFEASAKLKELRLDDFIAELSGHLGQRLDCSVLNHRVIGAGNHFERSQKVRTICLLDTAPGRKLFCGSKMFNQVSKLFRQTHH